MEIRLCDSLSLKWGLDTARGCGVIFKPTRLDPILPGWVHLLSIIRVSPVLVWTPNGERRRRREAETEGGDSSGQAGTCRRAGITKPSVLHPRAETTELQCLPRAWLCVHSPALFHRHQPQLCFSLHPEMKGELCTGASPADCPGPAAPFSSWQQFCCPREMVHSLERQ